MNTLYNFMGCLLTVSTDEINVWMSRVMARKLSPERQSEQVSGAHGSDVRVTAPPGNIRVRDHYRDKYAITRVSRVAHTHAIDGIAMTSDIIMQRTHLFRQ